MVYIGIEAKTFECPTLITCILYVLIKFLSNINGVATIQGDIPLQGDFSAEHMIFGGAFSNIFRCYQMQLHLQLQF